MDMYISIYTYIYIYIYIPSLLSPSGVGRYYDVVIQVESKRQALREATETLNEEGRSRPTRLQGIAASRGQECGSIYRSIYIYIYTCFYIPHSYPVWAWLGMSE